jgi:phosphonate transport system substrate-binding protein
MKPSLQNTLKYCLIVSLLCLSPFTLAQTFNFTAIPDQDASGLKERFDKVAQYLTKELGIDVNYIPVKSYAAAITAFRNNQVQLAWFGGLSGVKARSLVPGSQAIAQGVEDQWFVTYLIAHHSTGLTASSEFPTNIKDKTFTFGSKGSTSGRLMPEFYIRQNLGAPKETFKRMGFSGDHSRTIALVQAGSYQVGAVNFKVWDTMLAAGKINPDLVKVIWKTPHYPDYQWSVRGDVDQKFGKDMTAKIKAALLGMSDPDLLNSFPRQGFVSAQNSDYAPIKKTAQAIGLMD